MPEHKLSILSTRPLGPNLIASANQHGIDLDCLPFIKTEPIRDEDLDNCISRLASQPRTAVFTSMNAVDAVRQSLSPKTPDHWTVFCIGAATANHVSDFTGPDSIAGTAPSAAALAMLILQTKPAPGNITFFCGDQRRDELPDLLRQHGLPVEEIIVYRTRQTPHQLNKAYAGIAFFSPSAVHSFFSCNIPAPDTVLFAIGQTTEETIHAYSSNPTVRSGSPEKDSLIRMAIDHFKQ